MAANIPTVEDCIGVINNFKKITFVQDRSVQQKIQAEMTAQLIQTLAFCAEDFENPNGETRKQVKALVNAYYAAMARLVAKKSDFAKALDVFAENRNHPKFNAIRGMLLYVDTLNIVGDFSGFMRQGNILSKPLVRRRFWSENTVNDAEPKKKFLADMVEIFSIGFCDDDAKKRREILLLNSGAKTVEIGIYNTLCSMFFTGSGTILTANDALHKHETGLVEIIEAYASYDAEVNNDTVKIREKKRHKFEEKIKAKKSEIALSKRYLKIGEENMQNDFGGLFQMTDEDYKELAENILQAEAKKAEERSNLSNESRDEQAQITAIAERITARSNSTTKAKASGQGKQEIVVQPGIKGEKIVANSFDLSDPDSSDEDEDLFEVSAQDGQLIDEGNESNPQILEAAEIPSEKSDEKAEEIGTVTHVEKCADMSSLVSLIAMGLRGGNFSMAESCLEEAWNALNSKDVLIKQQYKGILEGLAVQCAIERCITAATNTESIEDAKENIQKAKELLGDIKDEQLKREYDQEVSAVSAELSMGEQTCKNINDKITSARNAPDVETARILIKEAKNLVEFGLIDNKRLQTYYRTKLSTLLQEIGEMVEKQIEDKITLACDASSDIQVVRGNIQEAIELLSRVQNPALREDCQGRLLDASQKLDEKINEQIKAKVEAAKNVCIQDVEGHIECDMGAVKELIHEASELLCGIENKELKTICAQLLLDLPLVIDEIIAKNIAEMCNNPIRDNIKNAVNLLINIENKEIQNGCKERLLIESRKLAKTDMDANMLSFYMREINVISDKDLDNADICLELAKDYLSHIKSQKMKLQYQIPLFQLDSELKAKRVLQMILEAQKDIGRINNLEDWKTAAEKVQRATLLCRDIIDSSADKKLYEASLSKLQQQLEDIKQTLVSPPPDVVNRSFSVSNSSTRAEVANSLFNVFNSLSSRSSQSSRDPVRPKPSSFTRKFT